MTQTILAPYQINDGSSFYRIATPINYMVSENFQFDQYHWRLNKFKTFPIQSGHRSIDRITGTAFDYLKLFERSLLQRYKHYDAWWVSRSLLSFPNHVEQKIKNVIYDFDDAVWLNGEASHCFKRYCQEAICVLAGNEFLADHARVYSTKVYVVPTCVDVNAFQKTNHNKDRFVVGWIGSSSGLHYLADIEDQLLNFFRKRKDARLQIISETFPTLLTRLAPYIDYLPWSRESEVDLINGFSVGIMPLADTEWEKGKCSFKMLQYMACEIPVVASLVGMNVEVLSQQRTYGSFGKGLDPHDSWCDALDYFYTKDSASLTELGQNGRKVVSDQFAVHAVAHKIEEVFRKNL